MSPRSKKKRHDGVLGWLAADPWRKLAAVVLALVSWEYLDTKVNKELKVNLDVVLTKPEDRPSYLLVIPSEGYTLRADDLVDADTQDPVRTISVHFKGEKGRVQDLENNVALLFQPTGAESKAAAAGGWLEFTKENLKHVEPGNRKVFLELNAGMTMRPSRIKMRIRPNDTRLLAVRAEHVLLDYEQKGDEERLSNPVFAPSQVKFSGPQEAIKGLDTNGALLLGQVKKIAEGDSVQVVLSVLPQLRDKDITVTPCVATYSIEANYREFEFKNVKVLIDDGHLPPGSSGDMFKLDPEVIEVLKIQAKGQLAQELASRNQDELHEWARKHLRVEVYLSPSDLQLESGYATNATIRLVQAETFDPEELRTRKTPMSIQISLKPKVGTKKKSSDG